MDALSVADQPDCAAGQPVGAVEHGVGGFDAGPGLTECDLGVAVLGLDRHQIVAVVAVEDPPVHEAVARKTALQLIAVGIGFAADRCRPAQ
jgi:hypothetical protein